LHWLLYLVADPEHAGDRPFLDVVDAALRGGVTAVQLRCKRASPRELLATGAEVRNLARRHGAMFLLNDRPDLALALEADGVHVGPADLPPTEARKLLPSPAKLGVSVSNIEEGMRAEQEGADYLGAGPVFRTATKADAGEPLGLDLLSRIAASVRIPVVGIGGITLENAESVWSAGCAGVALVSALMGAPDPEQAARALRTLGERSARREGCE
jgi:thiamine-phosphate diphosphorylase